MKYSFNNQIVDAVQFKFTTEGIAELEALCGSALGTVTKHRHPYGRGEADLGERIDENIFNTVRILLENDYAVKSAEGELYTVSEAEFTANYTPIE